MTRILGISGSLRKDSYNTALLRAAQSQVGPDVEFDIATLHGIPLYDGDLEQREGVPGPVTTLKERIMASDGVLLATPEYNNGIPGVFKNAVDWLSRPGSDIPRVFGGRLMLSRAGDEFRDGELHDATARGRVAEFVKGFAAFAGHAAS